mmetsp:Transcript_25960/g.56371  ORF Transcript_25960/g.56371 Transcript_25960/m.56371 type:complete len:411 (-) Transcript_25960:141-1373(-)|eukprot:CAMPEP_0206427930 /NCGR_PEP_ID=MMETSP0324_2-20121206/5341_1 /ASSEMBLY_ACC=CAM_ASM_000836 /TAXON_ID=2866 /ORGANISM="Crypthecodinium cohnii, Strain Seligo" /LENGTH=410 /DNA_ID=CAMNT_0053893319 /DNA_START=187 /DNA_END=1419 /DNA_ORIENTATION=+
MDDFVDLSEEISRIAREDFRAWPALVTVDGNIVRQRPPESEDDGFVCLEVTTRENIPYQKLCQIRRPENLELVSKVNPNISGGEVLKVYAPGDCLLRVAVNSTPRVLLMSLLTRAVPALCPGPQIPVLLRIFRRRDFPSPGLVTIVWASTLSEPDPDAPRDSRGPITTRTLDGRSCMFEILEPSADEGMSLVNSFTFLPAKHRWMLGLAGRAFAMRRRCVSQGLESLSEQPVELPYVILRLKKCSRGPPLLALTADQLKERTGPCEGVEPMFFNGDYWLQCAPVGSFRLGDYLRQLLVLLGLPEFVEDVYETLDGQQLIFFEAIFRKCVWAKIECGMMSFFAKHAPAYRFRNGGRSAPHLQVGAPLILAEEAEMCSPKDAPELPDFPLPDRQMWSCKNTFIHFEEPALVE